MLTGSEGPEDSQKAEAVFLPRPQGHRHRARLGRVGAWGEIYLEKHRSLLRGEVIG